jgi:polysaccharide pyruvyl transferase CsaB
VVLSADPASTQALHGVEACPRGPADVWKALTNARLLISGGGSLVQDVTSVRSALYYLGTMLTASLRGVPVVVVGQGIGPIRRRWVRRVAAAVFNRVQAISVRDRETVRTLASLGVRVPVHQGADLALLAPAAPPERGRTLLAACGISAEAGILAVAIRPWPHLQRVADLGAAIKQFAVRRGLQIIVLPFDRQRDQVVSATLAAGTGGRVVETASPADLLAVVGCTHLVLGVRLHSLVFAAAQSVPAVGLAYDPKVQAFAEDAGLPDVLPSNASPGAVQDALEQVWAQRAAVQARLRVVMPQLRRLAAAGIQSVLRVLEPMPGEELGGA